MSNHSFTDFFHKWDDSIRWNLAIGNLTRAWRSIRHDYNHGCSRIKDPEVIAKLRSIPECDVIHLQRYYQHPEYARDFMRCCKEFIAAAKSVGGLLGCPSVSIVREGKLVYVLTEYACWEFFPRVELERDLSPYHRFYPQALLH